MPIGLPLPTAELQLFPTTGTSWSAHLPRIALRWPLGDGMAIFALLRSSGGRPAAAWCTQLAVQPPVFRRNERRLRARPRAPCTFPASSPPRAAFASACSARLRSSASRNLRLISSSEPSGSGAASAMQTSSRDGHIHSFAHVIPACRLAGWLVVIGVAAQRTVMPPSGGPPLASPGRSGTAADSYHLQCRCEGVHVVRHTAILDTLASSCFPLEWSSKLDVFEEPLEFLADHVVRLGPESIACSQYAVGRK